MKTVRAEFESWYAAHHGPNCNQVAGALKSGSGIHAWRVWKASRIAALSEAVEILNQIGDDDMACDREIAKFNRAIKAVRARTRAGMEGQ